MFTVPPQLMRRIIEAIYHLAQGKLAACPFFNKDQIVDFAGVEKYFAGHHSISLHERALPPGVLGLTLKKVHYDGEPLDDGHADAWQWRPERRTRVFLLINSSLPPSWKRLFVTAHELGHALLHGTLLLGDGQPATHLADAKSPTLYHGYAEVEANLFALVLLLPDNLLLKGRRADGEFDLPTIEELYAGSTGLHVARTALQDRVSAYRLFHEKAQPATTWPFVSEGAGAEDDFCSSRGESGLREGTKNSYSE